MGFFGGEKAAKDAAEYIKKDYLTRNDYDETPPFSSRGKKRLPKRPDFNMNGGYRQWEGYFEGLEDVEVHKMEIY